MATQRKTEEVQQNREEVNQDDSVTKPSQGTEGAPEVDDAYFSTQTSAKQPDAMQAETQGETGQALPDDNDESK